VQKQTGQNLILNHPGNEDKQAFSFFYWHFFMQHTVIFYSALLKNMVRNSVRGFSLMPQELIAVEIVQISLIPIEI
jgi:hypothetical protein